MTIVHINRASELAFQMAEMRRYKPSSIAKRFGRNGPSPEQLEKYKAEVSAWNSRYRKLAAEQKKALAESDAEYRKRLSMI